MEIFCRYLKGFGSPVADWLEALKDIPGQHYRLTHRQAKEAERIGLAGYPRYTVFDRTGRRVYAQLGYAPPSSPRCGRPSTRPWPSRPPVATRRIYTASK